MSEATETIRQDIATIRDSMTDKMEQLESKVRGTVDTTVESVGKIFDLKQQVSDHPWASLGVAALAGYLLGSVGSGAAHSTPDPRPGEPMRYYVDDPKAAPAAGGHNRGRHGDSSGQALDLVGDIAEQFGDELQLITSAATAAVVSMLRDTIKGGLPQFDQEYAKARATPEGRDHTIGDSYEQPDSSSDPA